MCYFNARSIFNKMDEICALSFEHNPDFIMVTESWCDSSTCDSSVSIPGYILHRADRNSGKHGGGICCWLKSSFTCLNLFSNSIHFDVELMVLQIDFESFHCLLVLVYFPHGGSLNAQTISDLCDYVVSTVDQFLVNLPYHHIFMAGDFNGVDPSCFESNFDIDNVICEPTRKGNILDLVLLPHQFITSYSKPVMLPPVGHSDHNVILLKPSKELRFQSSSTLVFDLRESYLSRVFSSLSHIDWISVFQNTDQNQACDIFYDILRSALAQLPTNLITKKHSNKPWITNIINVAINKRYKAYRDRDWPLYHHYRDKVKKMIYNSKKSWSDNFISSHSIWDIHKIVLNTVRTDNNWLPRCDHEKPILDIINDINRRFSSEFVNDPICDNISILPVTQHLKFSEEEVELHLIKVNPKSSPGPDSIPSVIWSKLSSVLAHPLTIIFNKSLENTDLPTLWKEADIVPIPKTNPPQLSNLRPISLLPIPARIFEKILIKTFGHQFTDRYDAAQFGFRRKSSTVCALLNVENYITKSLQEKNVIGCHVMSIDLTKGFDRLSHNLLMKKMIDAEFDDFIIAFMCNYLSRRSQSVRWKMERSQKLPVLSGIPQGSSIGPLVFGFFTSDLQLPDDSDILLTKYADDILMVTKIRKFDRQSGLEDGYSEIVRWSESNLMEIKREKCQQLFISRSRCHDFSKFTISGIPLRRSLKFLGAIFDESLCWDLHVNAISKKACSRLSALRRIKPFLSKEDLVLVYNSTIRSILEYAAPIFFNISAASSHRLDVIQNRAHRIICGSSRCTCVHFLPLDYRRFILSTKLFKLLTGDQQHPLHFMTPDTNPYSNSYRMPECTSKMRHNSFLLTMIRASNRGLC